MKTHCEINVNTMKVYFIHDDDIWVFCALRREQVVSGTGLIVNTGFNFTTYKLHSKNNHCAVCVTL